MATKSLHVGNMAFASTDATLKEAFAAFDPTNVRVLNNQGFGFVDVEEDRMEAAIHGMNGKRLDGRDLKVSIASSRVDGSLGHWGADAGDGVASNDAVDDSRESRR